MWIMRQLCLKVAQKVLLKLKLNLTMKVSKFELSEILQYHQTSLHFLCPGGVE